MLERPDDAVKCWQAAPPDAPDLLSGRLTAHDLQSAKDQRVGTLSSKSVKNTKKLAS